MHALTTELNRLFTCSASDGVQPTVWISPDRCVRALVLELGRPADWDAVGAMWQAVQADLALPAPAIAVSGIDAYQLWFSLLEPVPAAVGSTFLSRLRARYWSDIADARLRLLPFTEPTSGEWVHAAPVPMLQECNGNWSAFVIPGMASLFADAPWLDAHPSPEAQAEVLSQVRSIQPTQFQAAREHLASAIPSGEQPVMPSHAHNTHLQVTRHPGNEAAAKGPHAFLLDVMNDPSIAMQWRLEAAKALLPYSESGAKIATRSD